MARSKTPSYTIEFKLKVEPFEAHLLDKALEVARILYNTCLSLALKCSNQVKQTKEFHQLRKLPPSKERTQGFKDLEKNMVLQNIAYTVRLWQPKNILVI